MAKIMLSPERIEVVREYAAKRVTKDWVYGNSKSAEKWSEIENWADFTIAQMTKGATTPAGCRRMVSQAWDVANKSTALAVKRDAERQAAIPQIKAERDWAIAQLKQEREKIGTSEYEGEMAMFLEEQVERFSKDLPSLKKNVDYVDRFGDEG